jgi:alpha-L-arabinofuranosidase
MNHSLTITALAAVLCTGLAQLACQADSPQAAKPSEAAAPSKEAGPPATDDKTATLTVSVDRPGVKVSPMLYGLFFEEINRAGDGGIYAEMVQNRSFEDGDKLPAWTLVKSDGAEGSMALDAAKPLNQPNPHSLRLEATRINAGGRVGAANEGFKGMAVRKNAEYLLSLHARCAGGFKGALTASLESADGKVLGSAKVEGLTEDWRKFDCVLPPGATDAAARLVVALSGPGTVWLDMVSLFPKDTWKARPNGLRPDLAQMLADLRPSFVRFPGGCWVEGDTLATAYRWKDTIGDLAQRRNLWNLWRYFSTNGLGYHEYLQMCEDLGAEPLFVINCGMSHKEVVPLDKMAEWVQDALDAIEYANGPADSKWGALRAKAGHPAPFNLKYMEIGNENGGKAYHERYALFHDAIKAKYPEIHLVADEWGGTPTNRTIEIVDEHYYNSPEFFIRNADKYDKYDRKGRKVYVGEYAVTNGAGKGNLRAAVGEAAFMTGMERNSDVVVLTSYAPLFANVHYKAWNPDLINFDASRAYGTPSYHVQKMFSQNCPEVVLPVELKTPAQPVAPRRGGVGVGTWGTQAEYKDFKVTRGESIMLDCNFASAAGWKTLHGKWQAQDGTYRQSSDETDVRAVTGDANWSDYTISLKARKTAGAEGFLILFHVRDDGNFSWWNIGGWGNRKHAIEVATGGGKSILGGEVSGKIETGRWYDIRVETQGQTVRCYLDGKLIHQVSYEPTSSLYAVAGRVGDEVIVKVVNVSARPQETLVQLRGARTVAPAGTEIVLTSANPADENTLEEPTKVAPVSRKVNDVSSSFRRTFPGNSVTVLRIKAVP